MKDYTIQISTLASLYPGARFVSVPRASTNPNVSIFDRLPENAYIGQQTLNRLLVAEEKRLLNRGVSHRQAKAQARENSLNIPTLFFGFHLTGDGILTAPIAGGGEFDSTDPHWKRPDNSQGGES
ncbi:MAG: hypothetical protein ACPW60_07080 [Methylohalobius sp. ZOD2]